MKSKKILACVLSVCCIMSVLLTVPAFAGEDSFAFNFTMKAYQWKNYTNDERLRTAPNTNNPWKVNLAFSEEGEGTIAIFWLAENNIAKTPQAHSQSVKQGTGKHYYKAYASAQNKNVVLGVMNNNDMTKSFKVSGYWDEEIGRLMDNIPG